MGCRVSDFKYDISIVFRALNEEKFFEQALQACQSQTLGDLTMEIILVDSGSTDRTLDIAEKYNCKIVNIPRKLFSFGRSLNWGCDAAQGEHLIFISAHCIPTHDKWLVNLITPLQDKSAQYAYGKQVGGKESKFSETQLFAKYFPDFDRLQDEDFFINNANSAILQNVWKKYTFDEEATGLEDMVLGKKIIEAGGKIAYVADAPVTHIHEENFKQVKHRYYREALTLREVMPEIHMGFLDFVRFTYAGIANDINVARHQKTLSKNFTSIFAFRFMQFWGSYRGQNENRKISREQKEMYYYPGVPKKPEKSNPSQSNKLVVNKN